jgi:hypothetical protein
VFAHNEVMTLPGERDLDEAVTALADAVIAERSVAP